MVVNPDRYELIVYDFMREDGNVAGHITVAARRQRVSPAHAKRAARSCARERNIKLRV